MTWCWFAPVESLVGGELAAAAVTSGDGAAEGLLAAWPAGRKPVAHAVRMDARIVDPSGARCWVSLVLAERDRAPIFDDVGVSAALRAVLRGPAPEAVSTLVRDSTHFAGAVTVRRDDRTLLVDDPFARLAPQRVMEVAAGLFGRTAAAPGPGTQRYSGHPWPVSGFDR